MRMSEQSAPDELVLTSERLRVTLSPFGARVTSVLASDRDGRMGEVTVGPADVRGWLDDVAYLGASVGRVANRIRNGRFELDGQTYQVATGPDGHALHGGPGSYDRRSWTVVDQGETTSGGHVEFQLVSPDGDNGFPGRVDVRAVYALEDDRLSVTYRASTDRRTPVNVTNHTYWNLAGTGTVEQHLVSVAAQRYVPVDADLLPTGELADVADTPFDLREPTPVGRHLRDGHPQLLRAQGYDHTLVLDEPADAESLRPAARLHDPASGRTLTITTDQPGVQFYSGNFLDGSLLYRGGAARQGDAVCLETQYFPDSVNQPDFPSILLEPGEEYLSRTVLRLTVE
jgi:aldose 1-epimerase